MERTEAETSKYLQKSNAVRTSSSSRSPSPQSREYINDDMEENVYRNINKHVNVDNIYDENFEKIKREKDFKLKNIIATSTPNMHSQNTGN
jgi:hypothetical protein